MIKCKELNREFETKEQMFAELVKNESKIVDIKKAALKFSESVSSFFTIKSDAEKSLSFVKEGYVYPVINTTNFMDSHGDVHFPGIWNKSLKDKAKKIYYLLEHDLQISKVIAFPNDITVFVKTLSWSELGFDYQGNTQALIFEVPKDKVKIREVKELFDYKTPFENSVRMRYITMSLAIDSKDPDFAKQKKIWDDRIDSIANKEYAEMQGFFWAIDEASIEKEGSLCLFGSNEATPVIYEAASGTSSKREPSTDTQNEKKKIFIN